VIRRRQEYITEMLQKQKFGYYKVLGGFFFGIVGAFLILPSIMSIPMSFSNTTFLVFPPKGFTTFWYQKFLTDESWIQPTLFSLKLALITTFVSLTIGIMASYALIRGVLPGKKIIHIFFISPMMIPVIVIAFAAYGLYAKLRLIGSTTGMVIAHTILSIPFVILIITANLVRFDQSLEMAARNLGANSLKTFMYVNLPLIKPGIIAAGIFSFRNSLDDLVMAMFLIGTTKMTLPLQMFTEIQMRINPVVAAASTVFIMAATGTIIILVFLRTDKKGSKT